MSRNSSNPKTMEAIKQITFLLQVTKRMNERMGTSNAPSPPSLAAHPPVNPRPFAFPLIPAHHHHLHPPAHAPSIIQGVAGGRPQDLSDRDFLHAKARLSLFPPPHTSDDKSDDRASPLPAIEEKKIKTFPHACLHENPHTPALPVDRPPCAVHVVVVVAGGRWYTRPKDHQPLNKITEIHPTDPDDTTTGPRRLLLGAPRQDRRLPRLRGRPRPGRCVHCMCMCMCIRCVCSERRRVRTGGGGAIPWTGQCC